MIINLIFPKENQVKTSENKYVVYILMSVGNDVNKLYNKIGYVEKYGFDLLICIIILFIFTCGNLWFYIQNNLQGLKKQWNDPSGNIRCNPFYLPFAAVIQPPPTGTTDLQFIENNIEYCTTQTLKEVAKDAANPLLLILDIFIDALKDVAYSLVGLMEFIQKFMKSVFNLLTQFSSYSSDYLSGVTSIFQSITSLMSKSMVINEVFMYIVQGFVDVVMSLMPSCFDKDTELTLADGITKKIVDIRVGDRLLYDGIVTGTFVFTANNVPMYSYHGVKVSGSHYVYTKNGLERISDIKEAKPIINYDEEYIYCLTTESKQISMKDMIFADYDDLDKQDCNKLLKWIQNRYLEKTNTYAIHQYLNGGLVDTPVQLVNGDTKMLTDIEIGDNLQGGIKVMGKVEIFSENLKVKSVAIGDKIIEGGPNIQLLDKKSGLNFLDSLEKEQYSNTNLYHLITDKGGFYVNQIYVGDYSVGMNLFFKEEIQEVLNRV